MKSRLLLGFFPASEPTPTGLTEAGNGPNNLVATGLTETGYSPNNLVATGLTEAGYSPNNLVATGLIEAGYSARLALRHSANALVANPLGLIENLEVTIPQLFQIALRHHQDGRLRDAEMLYRKILAAEPNHTEALHFLGVIAHQVGRNDLAAGWIRKSILLNPKNPVAYSNLGNALRGLGQLDDSIEACRQAIRIQPDLPEAHNNLANALVDRGLFDEAFAEYRYALQLKPDASQTHKGFADALRAQGYPTEAIVHYRRAISHKPDYSQAHNNLGATLANEGRYHEAVAAYHQAIEGNPHYADAYNNLAAAFAVQGQLDQAYEACCRALEIKEDFPEAHCNLGIVLRDRGEIHEGIHAFRRSLQLKPDYVTGHNNLGEPLQECRQLDQAVAAFSHALDLQPDYVEAYNNLANALRDQGKLDEAISTYRVALTYKPHSPDVHSNLIFALHFHPKSDSQAIWEEQRRWDEQFGFPGKESLRSNTIDPNPARKLRVGYVSPDFRDHPIGRYILPLLEHEDREQFEILCYADVMRPDWMTDRLRALAGEWRNTLGMSDADLADLIREDKVDILVDLAMHTADNRLPMFARRPAPVQVTWLAYPGSTGLRSIDYRLTDNHMDPPGPNPEWSSEEPVRLPDSWCCYNPLGEFPAVAALPALESGAVTFGSFNHFAKLNETVLALWARILTSVKRSRLFITCPDGSSKERIWTFFGLRGIPAERVELIGYVPRSEYLQLYQRIDLALDPFPYNGMTTTCDGLWMGVPALTLPGAMPASRAGLSLLTSIGLAEFAASSEEEYLRLAMDLSADLPRLAELRATMRARMQASPLMDGVRFARNVETAYSSMWERWHPSGG